MITAMKPYYHEPTLESVIELEKAMSGKWRVYDGEKWKIGWNTKEEAQMQAKRLNGTLIGYAVWNEEEQANVYREVEVIE